VEPYKVVLAPTSKWTRILLPPPTHVRNERAAAVLLEGISLWLDEKLHVALSVNEGKGGCCLGIYRGVRSLFYDVDVVQGSGRRRRGTRIRGVGDFADLRRLSLVRR
jgi:hypothetical protein